MARVPRHFHFVFGLRPQTEPFHVVYYLCLRSCLVVNRPDRITLHYHHEPHGEWWDLIRPELELSRVELVAAVDEFRYQARLVAESRHAHHADFIRLDALIRDGGVYADMDTLFLRPIPDALYEHACVLGREADVPDLRRGGVREASLCNALIMAEPGASFLRRWRDAMPDAFDGSWSGHSCALAARLAAAWPQEVHIEPEESFYPFMWTVEDLSRLLVENRDVAPGAYSLHLWNHLWWSRHRFDFSPFNGDRLTERFIRRGRTTYARLARPYLPPEERHGAWRRFGRNVRDRAREIWARRNEFKRWLAGVWG